jgi:DNA-directed RNA polymerase subunit F
MELIEGCLETGHFRLSEHALERMEEREITLPEIRWVLTNGYREKRRDTFSVEHQAWDYAVRGRTVDRKELRVVVSFDGNMVVITVIDLGQ